MNQMDVDGMNVTAQLLMLYRLQISRIVWELLLAQANAIMTGWRIGAKEFEECNRGDEKSCDIASIHHATCFFHDLCITWTFYPVTYICDDSQMISLVVKLLIVDIFLELGRVTNLVYGQALKTSGDALFPV